MKLHVRMYSETVSRPALGPYSLLENGYQVSSGVKWPERGVNPPPQSSVEVNETVELHLYYLSGSSWQVTGWTLP